MKQAIFAVILAIASIGSAVASPMSDAAQMGLAKLKDLRGCDVHTTTILGPVDERIFRELGVNVTSEPVYQNKGLYKKR